ncbi:SBBP repeat-containing protein [Granulosicoccaceae sp. 1_MG-2023]|nr:SBBP repeat-containing protein [Granulosicoccaceae sp. 1_MG-2023]
MQRNRFWLVLFGFATTLITLEATGVGMDTRSSAVPPLPAGPAALSTVPQSAAGTPENASPAPASRSTVLARIDRAPLYFEENIGQFSEDVQFTSSTPNYHLALRNGHATLTLNRSSDDGDGPRTAQLTMQALNGNTSDVVGLRRLRGTSSYYTSPKRSEWITGAPHYRGVKYKNIYPGINLEYYGNRDELEYDFIVKPGADPEPIRVAYEGVEQISLDEAGNALLQFGGDTLVQHAPYAYQRIGNDTRRVEAHYTLLEDGRSGAQPRLGFALGDYDPTHDLVIDPVLSYSALLGGDLFDAGGDITVDKFGNAYTVNRTFTPNPGADDPANIVCHYDCQSNILVRKFSADTNALLWSAMLSGESDDDGRGIAVDEQGYVYIAGWTTSEHFPVTGHRNPVFAGISDGFIAKLAPDGTDLVASVFVGTAGAEMLTDLALDNQGGVYVAGRSSLPDYASTQSGEKLTAVGTDGFVAKYSADLRKRRYARFFRGSQFDSVDAIAVNRSGELYLAGTTDSHDFAAGAVGDGPAGVSDAFLARLGSDGETLHFMRFFGGKGAESARSLVLDSHERPVLAGITTSADLPLHQAAFSKPGGAAQDWDGFVAKFSDDGRELIYSSYLGGSAHDYATGLAIDSEDRLYITGYTYSEDFPVQNPLYGERNGNSDIFISRLSADGRTLLSSSYFGGSAEESYPAIAVDSTSSTYLTGLTFSTDFPVNGAFGSSLAGARRVSGDGFIAKMTDLLDYTVASDTWQVLSMPYSPPPGATIEDVFGDDIPGRYLQSWFLYRYDPALARYTLLQADEQPVQGEAYWILQNTGQNVRIDMPEGSYSRLVRDDPHCPAPHGCFERPIRAATQEARYEFIGNPFPAPISWKSIRVSAKGSPCSAEAGGCNLREASEAGLVNDHGWAFLHGKNRKLEEGGVLQPWQGFWLQALPGAGDAAPRISIVR